MANKYQMKLNQRKNKAFTLAEVLVTLMIVGIVASMTIPALLKNIEDAKFRNQAKSAYAIVSQAMMLAMEDNGGSFLGVFTGTNDQIKDAFKGYFHYIKECNAGSCDGVCWSNDDKILNGSDLAWSDISGIILSNGMFVRIWHNPSWGSETCTETNYFEAPGECGAVEIDINGIEGPNTLGKDIHWIHILPNGLKPGGVDESKLFTSDCTTNGGGCLAEILKN